MSLTDKDAQRRLWCMFGDAEQLYRRARLVYAGTGKGADGKPAPVYISHNGEVWSHCRECTSEELAEHGLTQPPKPWSERVRQWAIDRNLIEGSKPKDQLAKGIEELGELAAGIIRGDMAKIEDSIVDEVVVMRIIAAQYGIDWDQCLEKGWDQIKDRNGKMVDGVFVKEAAN